MKKWAIAALVALVGCGGDGGPTEPLVPRESVAGTYVASRLLFDPTGPAFPEVDLIPRLTGSLPQLVVSGTDNQFQLIVRNPSTGFVTTVDATYALTATGVRLAFKNLADAQLLFLPQRAELEYDSAGGTLSFVSQVTIPRDRLIELVPEWSEDAQTIANPVPGLLQLQLTKATVVQLP